MTPPRAWNAETGEPIPITLIRKGARKHSNGRGPKPEREMTPIRASGRTIRASSSLAAPIIPVPLQLARRLAPRSQKRQAAILTGMMLADAVLAALRGR